MRIYSFRIDCSLMKYVAALEVLLAKCHEWQKNASRAVNLDTHVADITAMIVQWRKLELRLYRISFHEYFLPLPLLFASTSCPSHFFSRVLPALTTSFHEYFLSSSNPFMSTSYLHFFLAQEILVFIFFSPLFPVSITSCRPVFPPYLPHISLISPSHLPHTSLISPSYLPHISLISPSYLPHISLISPSFLPHISLISPSFHSLLCTNLYYVSK